MLNNYISGQAHVKQLVKQYSGFYKLERLNGKDCADCKVALEGNNMYRIYSGDKIVGVGKWDVAFDEESGGSYLDIDQLHGMMIWPSPRLISGMNTSYFEGKTK